MITIDLFETIQDVWHTICADFDITSDLPDMAVILDCVDPSRPNEAAQVVLVNLLSEAMEPRYTYSRVAGIMPTQETPTYVQKCTAVRPNP